MWTVPVQRPCYSDLSLNEKFEFSNLESIKNYGFKTVAIDYFVEESTIASKKKKKKGDQKDKEDVFPAPKEMTSNSSIQLLNRITIEFSDSGVSHKMNQSENIKKFDIIAVVPKTIQAFQYACGTMDIDIITFRPESRLPFKISRKLYRQAADRGIYFELMYAPAIKDATSRKNIINTAHMYHSIGKSKNIILSSAADTLIHLRGVYDLINLGHIFGLNEHQCREVLSTNARNVILKSELRRCGKSFLYTQEDDGSLIKSKKTRLE